MRSVLSIHIGVTRGRLAMVLRSIVFLLVELAGICFPMGSQVVSTYDHALQSYASVILGGKSCAQHPFYQAICTDEEFEYPK